MKRFLYLFPALAISLLAVSCKPTIDAPAPDKVNLDLSRYVAFGDYITAGFMNGGLSRESQQYAYPAILAQQLSKTGAPATFEQPYFSGSGTPMLALSFSANGTPVISNSQELIKFLQATCSGATSNTYDQYSTSASQTAALQNMGVPGLRLQQLRTAGLGNEANKNTPANFNPYFERMLPAGTNDTYLTVANVAKPTFFTLWLGMGDMVNYMYNGGACGSLPAQTTAIAELTALLDSLSGRRPGSQATRQGVLCNLPSYDDFPMTRIGNALQVQENLKKQHGSNLQLWIKIANFIDQSRPDTTIIVADKDVLTPKGLTTLGQPEQVTVNGTTQTIGHGFSEHNPLLSDEVLDRNEVLQLIQWISTMNSQINALVTANNSPYRLQVILADMNALFGTLRNGVIYNGVKYNLDPIKGGVFSLDNFSLTPRGQAIVANKIIQTMNQEVIPKSLKFTGFGTRIPEVNVNDYPTLEL